MASSSAAIEMTAVPPDPSIQAGRSETPPSPLTTTRRRRVEGRPLDPAEGLHGDQDPAAAVGGADHPQGGAVLAGHAQLAAGAAAAGGDPLGVVLAVARPALQLGVVEGAGQLVPDDPAQRQPAQLEGGNGLQLDRPVEHHLGEDAAAGPRPVPGGGDPGLRPAEQRVVAGGVEDPEPVQGADLAAMGTPSKCSSRRLKPVPTVVRAARP